MGYTIVIIIAALVLGLIDIRDQIKENDIKPYRYLIKLICMMIIVACIVIIEKEV